MQSKLADDILTHTISGSGRQGNHGYCREFLPHLQQVAVVGAKLVAPLGDAVGLVDGDEAQVQAVKKALKSRQGPAASGAT